MKNVVCGLHLCIRVLVIFVYVRWLIPLIILSVRRKLQHSDLYPNPPELDSEELLKKFNKLVSVASYSHQVLVFTHQILCSLNIRLTILKISVLAR